MNRAAKLYRPLSFLIILILVFSLLSGCSSGETNQIKSHRNEEDEFTFPGIKWLINVNDALTILFEKYRDTPYTFENPRGHFNLCDSLASWGYLIKTKDTDNPLLWDWGNERIGFISVNCINDPDVSIKEVSAEYLLVYSVTVHFLDGDMDKANEMIQNLDKLYGPGKARPTATYDLKYYWTDKNNNTITLMLDTEAYYPLSLEFKCGDVQAYADSENAKEEDPE